MKSLPLTAILSALLLTFTLPGHSQTALRAGFVEGADVMLYLDGEKMNQSAFSKAIEEMAGEEQRQMKEERMAAMKEATGMTEEDIKVLVFSMDLEGINFQSQDPEELENASAIMAIEFARELTLDQVVAGLELMAKDNDPKPEFTRQTVDGLDVVVIGGDGPQDQGPDQAFATLTPDNKTLLLAFNTRSLQDGLQRVAEGVMSAPGDDMATAVRSMGNRSFRFALVLPMEARQLIQEGVHAAAAQGGMGGMMMPFATTRSLLVSAEAADALDVGISLDLGDPGNATQAAGMMEGMLPMLMMGLQQQLGPQAMNLAQKIKIAPSDSVVSLQLNLTAEEISAFSEQAGGGF